MNDIIERLERIERALIDLAGQRAAQEWYTTARIAELIGKSDYTVREWCRKEQVPAKKAANGRGWLISHADLLRIRNGELPLPEHQAHRGIERRRA